MSEGLSPKKVRRVIKDIEERPEATSQFTANRYPYTYAYDYLRSHPEDFGLPRGLARMDCASLLKNNKDKEKICVLLADAYLREWNIVDG